jgi:mono/diheme cytochrome c family protein
MPHAVRALCRSIWVVAALCAPGQAAQAQTQSAVVRGQAIAEQACAGCHAVEGPGGGTIQGRDVPSLRAIAGRGWTPQRLESFITTPHRPMPATPLEPADVRAVAAYILSLK